MEPNSKVLDDFLEQFEDESLEHHGILGMKWGVRRYQNKDGSLTEAGRKRRGLKDHVEVTKTKHKERSEKRKEEKSKKISEKERRKIEKKAKEAAAMHNKILRDSKLLDKYKDSGEFSDEEIDKAIKKFERDKKLSDLVAADVERGVRYINTFTKYVSSASAAYNAAAKVYNAFGAENEDELLPLINDQGKKKKAGKGDKK